MVTVPTLAKPCSRCQGSLYIDVDDEDYYLKCRSCARSVKILNFSGVSDYGRSKLRDLFDTLKLSSWFSGIKKHRSKASTPFIGNPVDRAIASTVNLSNYVEVIIGILTEELKAKDEKTNDAIQDYIKDLKHIEQVLHALFIKLKEGDSTIPDFRFKIMSALSGELEISAH